MTHLLVSTCYQTKLGSTHEHSKVHLLTQVVVKESAVFTAGYQAKLPWWLRWQRICLQCTRLRFDPLEKGMATHSSILAWRISWTEVPSMLQSMGSQIIGQD